MPNRFPAPKSKRRHERRRYGDVQRLAPIHWAFLPSLVFSQTTATPEMLALAPTSMKAPASPFQHCGALGAAATGAGAAGAGVWPAQAVSPRAMADVARKVRMKFS